MFQCRSRLCLWCKFISSSLAIDVVSFNAARGFVCGARSILLYVDMNFRGFNAARGFVCGARTRKSSTACRMSSFQCRSRLCLWCKWRSSFLHYIDPKFQCRSRLCLWCKLEAFRGNTVGIEVSMPHAALFVVQAEHSISFGTNLEVSMPHAALFVVQVERMPMIVHPSLCFNAARGFVCGARLSFFANLILSQVSMPHAALFVVQVIKRTLRRISPHSFNAARGFVCGASSSYQSISYPLVFQCRTRLCLWCKYKLLVVYRL